MPSWFKFLLFLKLRIPVILVLLFFSVNCLAQRTEKLEITPFYGWQLSDKIYNEEKEISIENSSNFGFSFNFPVANKPGLRGELFYSRQNTSLRSKEDSSLENTTFFSMSVEYFNAGATYQENYGIFSPIFLITVGATRFSPKHTEYEDEWRVSAAIAFGLKAYLISQLGIRIQTRLLLPLQLGSGSIFCSSNQCLISVEAGIVTLQADITAGLIIAL